MTARLPPTPRRLRRARAEGDLPRSRNLLPPLAWTVAASLGALSAPDLLAALRRLAAPALQLARQPSPHLHHALHDALEPLSDLAFALALPLGGAWLTLAFGGMLLIGPGFDLQHLTSRGLRLRPDLPLQAAREALHPAAWGLGLLRFAALLLGGAAALLTAAQHLLPRIGDDPLQLTLPPTLLASPAALLAAWTLLGLAEYAIARHRWWQRLHMSPQEAARERRDQEGDPATAQARERAARAPLPLDHLHRIPEATLILTDGRSLAAALRYDGAPGSTPHLLLSGAGSAGDAILTLARTHRRPIHHDPALARALLPLEPGAPLPKALFDPVARVLLALNLTPRRRTGP